jgi:4-hydroxybenzoate polyprenyltransferase
MAGSWLGSDDHGPKIYVEALSLVNWRMIVVDGSWLMVYVGHASSSTSQSPSVREPLLNNESRTANRRIPWTALADLIRLRNQSGTLLLMLPSWWALVLANNGHPPVRLLAIFAAGSFLMRSAGVILNDLADRNLDREVIRTRDRPLAAGRLALSEALVAAAVLIGLAAILVLFLDPLAMTLSPVALALAAIYPYAKRVLRIPQLVLGLAFGWGVMMAWAASGGTLETGAWLLYGATVCWTLAYDTIYALQDRDGDIRAGVGSSAVLFGPHTWLAVAGMLALTLALLAEAGLLAGAGTFFYLALVGVAGFFARQVRELRSGVSPQRAFQLFKQHIWAGVAILAGLWVGLL